MRKFYSLLIFLIASSVLFAQKNGTVKGIAYDTLAKQAVASATITVVQKKDSSLVSFTMTNSKGYFELNGIPNGEYRLFITHISYYNRNKYFTIDDNHKNIDLGDIIMNDKNKILEEVVIKNEAPPVTLVDDTIQYNANSFKTQPNSNVEQLLKKLPGIQVQKDGTIKAQGETVQKVLVDGKEFFGNDPKVATKNLPADAVDKIQVYNKQSDQAQLTGFEDGNYEKTINLKLKEDKKKGLFGKISGGEGTDGRYEGKFNVNSFKGARQMSAIGMGNNDNSDGFSFMDVLNFTGALSQLKNNLNGGAINISVTTADMAGMGGQNNKTGINTSRASGVNYNNIIGKKIDLMSNYFYNSYNPYSESHIQRQYLLPDSTYSYVQNSSTNNLNNGHRFNLNVLYQIDSFNSIRFTPSFSYQQTSNKSQSNYQTFGGNGALANQGFSDNSSNGSGYNFQNTIMYRRKFHRKGRTFSLSLQTSLNNSTGNGSLSSITNFYNPLGSLIMADTLNQQNTNESNLKGFAAKAVYTEPLFKHSLMEFSAGKSATDNTSQKTTMNYNALSGKYDVLNPQLTNDFGNNYDYTTGGIRIRTQNKKYNYTIGATWQQADLQGKIISGVKDSVITKTFRNILPNARFQYNFSKFKMFAINYSTYTTQPSLSQLQPVPDVSDPLNIKVGNPDLKQEFTQAFQGNMNWVSPYRSENFFMFFNMNETQNKIVNYDSVNQFGVKTTKPVNVNGVYNLNANINWGMPLHFLKARFDIGTDFGYNKGRQFINTIANDIKTFSMGPDIRLNITPKDKLDIALLARLNYNNTKYSLQSALNNKYFQQEYETDIDWQLPKNFFFSTDFTYTINSQRASGFNTSVPLWNMSISKQMLHYNRGELKFRVSDLLNQNIGISRSTNQNYIEDSRVMTLRRFFMLSFTYSLSKTGLNKEGKGGFMRVIAK